MASNFTYEIVESLGSLSSTAKGWVKEVNLIKWNGKEPKIDIREWSPEHDKMGKGVTLSNEEIKRLKEILNEMD